MTFFREIEKKNPKTHLEARNSLDIQSCPEKKSSAGGITLPDFKLCYRGIIAKLA
jgi:hypothetical protein